MTKPAHDRKGSRGAEPTDGRQGRSRSLAVVALVAVLALGGVLFIISTDGDEAAQGVEPTGEPVPELVLNGLRGGDLVLSDLPDGPIVLNFYASWCPPCVAEMRDALGPVDRALGGDVMIVGIAMQDTPDGAVAIAEETNVDYRLVEDPNGEAFRAFGAVAMPATVYVHDGEIVARHNGTFTRRQFEDQLREFLGVEVPDAG